MDKTMFTTFMDTVRSLSYLRASSQYGFLVEEETGVKMLLSTLLYLTESLYCQKKRMRDGRRTVEPEVIEIFT